MSKILCLIFSVVLLMGMALQVSAAAAPYQTYTYDIEGMAVYSPHAYTPSEALTSYEMNMPHALNGATDIFVDDREWKYISNTKNNTVEVLDENFIYQFSIGKFINKQGVQDGLYEPAGLYVYDGKLYVCDTMNARIVIFDLEGNFLDIVEAPSADIMGSDTVFRPVAVAVNKSGTMYIVSKTTYSGIIALNSDGSFQAFVGAQKATVSMAVRIRRMIFPNIVTESYLSTPYKNLTMDSDGIVWATIIFDDADADNLANSLLSGTINETYAPVKQLNPKGDDIMVRQGFTMPAGEVNFASAATASMGKHTGPSELVDIAIGSNGMWSVLDSKRGKIYTYDSEGNMLFAFGDQGAQLGNLAAPTAISYCGSDILVLDSTLNSVTVFKRTDYGDVIDLALQHNNERKYSEGFEDWKDILKRNINFDAAYVGIGKNLYRQAENTSIIESLPEEERETFALTKYQEAMDYYKDAHETTNYSIAFKAWRKAMTEKWILLILLVIVVLVVAVAKMFGYIGKKNKAGVVKAGKRTLWEEFLYGFYVMMHPFDGFWDLKHEKRGSVRGGLCIVALTGAALLYQKVGSAYLFGGGTGAKGNVFGVVIAFVVVFVLWCLANWCLTTLFDGEGTLKDIFIATAYALMPMPLLIIPATIATNFASLTEAEMITLILGLSYVWTGMLIFFGSMTTHGYSMGRNILISIFTLVGMIFILFVAVLFWNLITRMVSFVTDIVTELSYRAQ